MRTIMDTTDLAAYRNFEFLFFYSTVISFIPGSFLYDPDVFWHIRTGEWIFSNTKFPTVDLHCTLRLEDHGFDGVVIRDFHRRRIQIWPLACVVILAAVVCATIVGICVSTWCDISNSYRDSSDSGTSVSNQSALSCPTSYFYVF